MDDLEPVGSEELWRDVLTGTQPDLRVGRRLLKHLPAQTRCKLCGAPLRGFVSPLMRLIGKRAWPSNPTYCSSCFAYLVAHRGGAEIECSLLFADVRGSTALGERLRPSDLRDLMDRFFRVAAAVLVEHDAIVDRFVGDQTIGIFVPALTGEAHAARAVAAAVALLEATGHAQGAPWVPIGVGVHTGVAFVGCVGSESHVDLTAIGDPVNTAARLASVAGPGEVLVTIAAASAAGIDTERLERRELDLKGKQAPTAVHVLGQGSARAASERDGVRLR